MKDWRGYTIVDRPGFWQVSCTLQNGGKEVFGPYTYMYAKAMFDRIDKEWTQQFPNHKYSGFSLRKA